MRTILKNATIFDTCGQGSKANILVENDRIIRLTREGIAVSAAEYDMTGYTILPGFINTHVHLMDCYDGFNEEKLKRWLNSGVTYLRDQGILSKHSIVDASSWKERVEKTYSFPHLFVCGKFISAKKGYGGTEPLEVASKEEARKAVEYQLQNGADHIKVSLDKGYDAYTKSLSLLDEPVLAAICDQTHKHGKKVSAHVNTNEMLSVLLRAGIDEVAHACYDRISDENLSFMVKNNVCMTPTLSVYGEITSQFGVPFLYAAMDNTKRFVDMGGIIGFGNDYIEEKALWSPVGMPMMEIELLLKAGLTISQVINAATIGGAAILGRDDIGRVEENYKADLIAVKGNPYEIPYLLSNVDFVMRDGIVIKANV